MPHSSRSLTEVLGNPDLIALISTPPPTSCFSCLRRNSVHTGKTGKQMEAFCDDTISPQQWNFPDFVKSP